jgi:hypothetical protein
MSDDAASAPARADGAEEPPRRDYDEMLADLDALLDEAMQKVESGRVYSAENERVRIKWIRVACTVIDTRRKVQGDCDLDELAKRV